MAEVKHVFIKLGFGKPSSAVGMTAQRLDQAAGLDGLKSSVVYNICVRAVETLQMASLARRAAKQQELTGGCAVDAGSSQAITHGDARACHSVVVENSGKHVVLLQYNARSTAMCGKHYIAVLMAWY